MFAVSRSKRYPEPILCDEVVVHAHDCRGCDLFDWYITYFVRLHVLHLNALASHSYKVPLLRIVKGSTSGQDCTAGHKANHGNKARSKFCVALTSICEEVPPTLVATTAPRTPNRSCRGSSHTATWFVCMCKVERPPVQGKGEACKIFFSLKRRSGSLLRASMPIANTLQQHETTCAWIVFVGDSVQYNISKDVR